MLYAFRMLFVLTLVVPLSAQADDCKQALDVWRDQARKKLGVWISPDNTCDKTRRVHQLEVEEKGMMERIRQVCPQDLFTRISCREECIKKNIADAAQKVSEFCKR